MTSGNVPVLPKFIPFTEPSNIEELSICIGVEENLLKLATGSEKNFLFEQHLIPKKNKRAEGQYREVWEANGLIAAAY